MPAEAWSGPADPELVLRQVFGHPEFRGRQREIVDHVVGGGSGLVLMPTGGGKSLCYQVPALCRPGIGVVVSPLIALMEDQVAAMRQQGIAAAALHSDLEPEARAEARRAFREGRLDLLYVSPERLAMDGMLDELDEHRVALFAVDEAHCISQWGHHFRPEYRALTILADRFPGVPRLALTATADPRTAEDIRRLLGLLDEPVFKGGFDRPNIRIEAAERTAERQQVRSFLREASDGRGAGIIYCGSRARAERTAEWLRGDGWDATPFHAGMEAADKRAAHKRFAAGDAVIMCATIAFGMGIDRPDVRFVCHTELPKSPEGWYQEIGRAGRDGLPARALLLYAAGDIAIARRRIAESAAPEAQTAIERMRLDSMIAIAEAAECRRRPLLRCFGETPSDGPCGQCDNCLSPPRLWDGTVAAQKLVSACLRTGQRFGLGHLTDVLRGEKSEKVLRFGHDELPTFGVGRDLDVQGWRAVARQLVARGVMDLHVEERPGQAPAPPVYVVLPDAARPLLRGEASLTLRADVTAPVARRGNNAPAPAGPPIPRGSRFEALRGWRGTTAKAQGVPAYIVFPDRTLDEIAARNPSTLDALADVPGVGQSKLGRYGPAILELLRGCE
ncbi:ATP-dependent DNA helicase RecQ [Humitalea rosea]|uniref:DNA helicase RecQ n=1 Tax=Humitalea rosea TaxID=990373 RepID=A0A2W7HTV8_9PROT|nr:DNA helicase RecQ [Humitalea rosea]PZW37657.1 ATP-dependent DNA helicase RecQ [Humitalea rosea]